MFYFCQAPGGKLENILKSERHILKPLVIRDQRIEKTNQKKKEMMCNRCLNIVMFEPRFPP